MSLTTKVAGDSAIERYDQDPPLHLKSTTYVYVYSGTMAPLVADIPLSHVAIADCKERAASSKDQKDILATTKSVSSTKAYPPKIDLSREIGQINSAL
jgi:hypothetical protein